MNKLRIFQNKKLGVSPRHSNKTRILASRLSFSVMLLLIFFCFTLGIGYWNNNAEATSPSLLEFKQSQLKAIDWIKAHEEEVLATDNPALWWMLHDSATLSKNAYLTDLYTKYYERYLANEPSNPWHHLFDHNSQVWLQTYQYEQLPDYNQLFLYGLSCQPTLREEPQVAKLLSVDSCDKVGTLAYLQNTTCATHQLMGVYFMQQRKCENGINTQALKSSLQNQIALEATWDFRGIVDFYLQKVLMLAVTGATDKIKPQWLKRVIHAQRPDGGWDNFYEFIKLDKDHSIGWSAKGVLWVRKPESNFHTTAQGLYLMSILSSKAPQKNVQIAHHQIEVKTN